MAKRVIAHLDRLVAVEHVELQRVRQVIAVAEVKILIKRNTQ